MCVHGSLCIGLGVDLSRCQSHWDLLDQHSDDDDDDAFTIVMFNFFYIYHDK